MFSQTAEYALRAMTWLAKTPQTLVPTGDLATATMVPPHYLAKVLQQMAASGLITGRRGVGGGYRLSRDPAEITLREVVHAVSPIERMAACPTRQPGEPLCPLHQVLDSITGSVLDTLEATSLADLANQRTGQEAQLCTAGTDGRASAPAPAGLANGAANR